MQHFMISICIPVYNVNLAPLLNQLTERIKHLPVPCEIICIDDASEKKYQDINQEAAKASVYIQLPANIGRARIRNLFLQYAKYENLLFLDCDSLIVHNDFLLAYVQYIQQHNNYGVVCGGRIYGAKPRNTKYRLRWLYGTKRENKSVNARNQNPNASFMTNNFVISQYIFRQTKFDERIKNYGHEDTLFGYTLKKQNILVHHIKNPVLNGHLENNKIYLEQTKEAVINLTHILSYVNYEADFIKDVPLLRFYYKIRQSKALLRLLFSVKQPALEWILKRGYAPLLLFDFYKLGILLKEMKKLSGSSVASTITF